MNSYLAALFTFIIIFTFLGLVRSLAGRGMISGKWGHKIIHVGTGTIFVLCWLMYPDVRNGRWLAALIPLVLTVLSALIGMGVIRDEAAIKAATRTGDRREMLRGPLFYGMMLIAMTLIYWKDSLSGIPALMMMAGSDGIGDSIGGPLHSTDAFWSRQKSLVNSLSVFAGGWLLSIFIFAVYVWMGTFSGPVNKFLLPVTWIALGAALIKWLPLKDVENISVVIASVLIGVLVF